MRQMPAKRKERGFFICKCNLFSSHDTAAKEAVRRVSLGSGCRYRIPSCNSSSLRSRTRTFVPGFGDFVADRTPRVKIRSAMKKTQLSPMS